MHVEIANMLWMFAIYIYKHAETTNPQLYMEMISKSSYNIK